VAANIGLDPSALYESGQAISSLSLDKIKNQHHCTLHPSTRIGTQSWDWSLLVENADRGTVKSLVMQSIKSGCFGNK
jgi:hypothetical protein